VVNWRKTEAYKKGTEELRPVREKKNIGKTKKGKRRGGGPEGRVDG